MSANGNLLYLTQGVRGYPLLGQKNTKIGLEFHLEFPRNKCKCPECGSRDVILKGSYPRRWRALQMGLLPAWITMDVPRVKCKACEKSCQVKVSFADPHRRYTRCFERFVLSLCARATNT